MAGGVNLEELAGWMVFLIWAPTEYPKIKAVDNYRNENNEFTTRI
jgi:hypothetical protein